MRLLSLIVLAFLPGTLGFFGSISRFFARFKPSFRPTAVTPSPARLSVGRGNVPAYTPPHGNLQSIGPQQAKFVGLQELSGKLTELPTGGRPQSHGYDPSAIYPASLSHPPSIGWKVNSNGPQTIHPNNPSNRHDMGFSGASQQIYPPAAYHGQGATNIQPKLVNSVHYHLYHLQQIHMATQQTQDKQVYVAPEHQTTVITQEAQARRLNYT
ncbi:hypothetical protein CP532_5670 [Ophiocordyceps camponoti-leonardi (nom. inval.)]|nr:hypothetical protein CP532_5670 [Ophiocordyceps camponoti-leonardi (nom. inval.)]